jgi:hypothetical protein
VIETFVWQRRRHQFNTTAGCYENADKRGDPGCSSLFDSSQQAELITIVGYAATALLAGGATALLLTGDTPEPRRSSSARVALGWACVPGVGVSAVSCRLSF